MQFCSVNLQLLNPQQMQTSPFKIPWSASEQCIILYKYGLVMRAIVQIVPRLHCNERFDWSTSGQQITMYKSTFIYWPAKHCLLQRCVNAQAAHCPWRHQQVGSYKYALKELFTGSYAKLIILLIDEVNDIKLQFNELVK